MARIIGCQLGRQSLSGSSFLFGLSSSSSESANTFFHKLLFRFGQIVVLIAT
ncbi:MULTISPECIES: hypothetical protein [unclassified Bradyrhizobium]|uniref:hypothetical protein n=1 Tax=unclassified Bradyrhizobium TaxID=2631580 RepID=UPI00211EBDF5|nr:MULTISPECIES: hypothetical protein [unclassified Bradyrhizobium]